MPYLSKLVKRLALIWPMILAAAACGESVAGVDAAALHPDSLALVRVLPETILVQPGTSARLRAEARNNAGAVMVNRPIEWSSSDTTIIQVDDAGLLTAVSSGAAYVTATSRGRSGKTHVKSTTTPVAPTVRITPSSGSVAPGQSLAFAAQLVYGTDSITTPASTHWSSSDLSIASIDAAGRATGLAPGTVLIRVEADGRVGSASLMVVEAVASQLGILTQPGGALLGELLTQQPVVQVRNAAGQVVNTAIAVTASIASGPGALTGTTSVTSVAGVATFTNLRISGTAGTHTIRFSASGLTASVSQAVTIGSIAPPAPGAVNFSSDWRSATGSSVLAIRDNGKWPTWSWGGSCTTAPSTCGVKIMDEPDFPSGRAFWSGYIGDRTSTGAAVSGGGTLVVEAAANKWPLPAIGQTLFHRIYLKNSINAPRFGRNLSRGGHHPVEGWGDDPVLGGNCAFHWEYRFDARADGTFAWEIANLRNQGSWVKSGLQLNRAYLLEVGYTRTATNRWTVRARLDGVDQGQIFAGDAEIGAFCLQSLFVGNNDPGYGSNTSDTDITRWRNYNNSPVPGGPYSDLDAMRWGAIAVAVRNSATDWIGPYDLTRGW